MDLLAWLNICDTSERLRYNVTVMYCTDCVQDSHWIRKKASQYIKSCTCDMLCIIFYFRSQSWLQFVMGDLQMHCITTTVGSRKTRAALICSVFRRYLTKKFLRISGDLKISSNWIVDVSWIIVATSTENVYCNSMAECYHSRNTNILLKNLFDK